MSHALCLLAPPCYGLVGYIFQLMESVFALGAFTQINDALNFGQLVEFCNILDSGTCSRHNVIAHLAVQRHAMMQSDKTKAVRNRVPPASMATD